MSTEPEDGAQPRRRAPDRTTSDVAREAFRNRVIEGDRPQRKRTPGDDDPAA